MIRAGKAEGWLNTPAQSLRLLKTSTGVDFGPSVITSIQGKGAALVADRACSNDNGSEMVLISVPTDIILSKETILLYARSDKHLRDVIESVGTWAESTRFLVMIFLLLQITHNCPGLPEHVGVSSPLDDYVKSLPLEDLPTSWQDDEINSVVGTSLKPAVEAKMNTLYREYDQLRKATAAIPWCQRVWWDEVDGLLRFDDWRHVDAMYRSRALDFPGIGHCMIPCIDLANHASGYDTVARYETAPDGSAQLLLRDDNRLRAGDEITITYGDDKGACEMIFSYGFLESSMESARMMFLDMSIPEDDPLRKAKQHVANCAPGIRLSETEDGGVEWDSEYVLLAAVNEEDGLGFEVLQTVDGQRELHVFWQGEPMANAECLPPKLRASRLWPVFRLRAVALIQDRVQQQLQEIQRANVEIAARERGQARQATLNLAMRLRQLETRLLEEADEQLEAEKASLAEEGVVREFLGQAGSNEPGQEDEGSDDFA